ncbi:hypothetical protein BU26DRAFT_145084 [Trematosphaeria pertusa]|uniref:Uncharacterized protein n=1 Tax=Trematosphaeria pertusa TaxID=390896 RepID=A0A6A6IWV7_9PLEO|nr:uncharacterized protein BU26DRAFT_145084 [Trematosphaeria pertusa]KAF2254778.1 hypothetical protein BU26DRAFT_145084 [Trematosphaeria pertusa]
MALIRNQLGGSSLLATSPGPRSSCHPSPTTLAPRRCNPFALSVLVPHLSTQAACFSSHNPDCPAQESHTTCAVSNECAFRQNSHDLRLAPATSTSARGAFGGKHPEGVSIFLEAWLCSYIYLVRRAPICLKRHGSCRMGRPASFGPCSLRSARVSRRTLATPLQHASRC